MRQELMGSGLPTLITLTGEEYPYMGWGFRNIWRGMKKVARYNPASMIYRAAKKKKVYRYTPWSMAYRAAKKKPLFKGDEPERLYRNRIAAMQAVSALPFSPSSINAALEAETPFIENRYEGDESFSPIIDTMEGDVTKTVLAVAAGAGLLYILAKNKIIRL
jgi:hypothetical protein